MSKKIPFARLAATVGLGVSLLAGSLVAPAAAQAEGEIRIAEQFGIVYLLLNVVRDQNLIEKYGKQEGIDIKVDWTQLSGGAAGQLGPVDLDVDAFLLAVFFDQVLVTHHVEQQVDDAELLGNANLSFGLGGRRCNKAAGQQADAQADRGGQARKWDFLGHGLAPDQKGASPWMVVRNSLRRRWLGQPAARWISERLSQNTRSWGFH